VAVTGWWDSRWMTFPSYFSMFYFFIMNMYYLYNLKKYKAALRGEKNLPLLKGMIRIGGSLLRIKREDAIYYIGEHHSSYLKQVFQRCPCF